MQLHRNDERTTRFVVRGLAEPWSSREVIAGWCHRAEPREFFTPLISASPFEAFCRYAPDRAGGQPTAAVFLRPCRG